MQSNTSRPGLSHSLIGLLTTLVNVIASQKGHFSTTAKISTAVISVCCGWMLGGTIWYSRQQDKIMTQCDKEIVRNYGN
jgi:hypothetical protein